MRPPLIRKRSKPVMVILSGAGFSAGFGLPITNDLNRLVELPCVRPQSLFHSCAGVFLGEYPLKEFLSPSSRIPDFEYLLTIWDGYRRQLRLIEPAKARKHDDAYRRLIDHICCHLTRLCDEIPSNPDCLSRFNQLANWLSRANHQYDIRLLTLNYDLVWERLCESVGITIGYMHRRRVSNIVIRKLHGSVNWFELQASQRSVRSRQPMEEIHRSTHSSVCAYSGTQWPYFPSDRRVDVNPPLILPMATKEYGGIFNRIWSAAGYDISIADKLLIVGYSFPQLDVFAQEFLVARLRERGRPVDYVLPSGASLDRVRDLLQGEGISVNFKLQKWELADFEQLL